MAETTARTRILIADNDIRTQERIKKILQRQYDLLAVDNGKSALEAISNFKPNLVLSSIKLPELSGSELLIQLRSNPKTCNVPFILLSDPTDGNLRIEGLNFGVICIMKPFTEAELLGRVGCQLIMSKLENKYSVES